MSNIIKGKHLENHVLELGLTRVFKDIVIKEKGHPEENHEIVEVRPSGGYFQTAELYEEALQKVQVILDQAMKDAEEIRDRAAEEGHQAGYDAGYDEGFRKAYEVHQEVLKSRQDEFVEAMKKSIESVTEEKEKILDKYIDDLKKVALTIAEKVIQTSLKSSGEVIKRMIVAATGKLKKTQWAKIYVSQEDAGMIIQGDVGLLSELAHVSGNIKIIAMDNAEDGTCIIELPGEIIDVSVNTQLENIKGILNNARL